MQETQVPSQGQEDPLETEMATYSSILAFRIPWTVKLASKESACNVGDPGLIPGLGRSLGEGNGNPL